MKNVSLKFVDIMIGVILGLGFQWWPELHLSWQYLAFVFVYIDIVDYWIDYGPSLHKFPPKREIDVIIDMAIMFGLFLYIYSTQHVFIGFLGAFVVFKMLDIIWLLRAKVNHSPDGTEGKFVSTWLLFDMIEIILAIILAIVASFVALPILLLIVFIAARVVIRILASTQYKRFYLA